MAPISMFREHTMIRTTALALAALPLAACTAATMGEAETAPPPLVQGECKAEAGQPFVGQKASAETGAALMKATGARSLRWVPPRSAVTMDYRADRLTVSYDDDMVIERVSCT